MTAAEIRSRFEGVKNPEWLARIMTPVVDEETQSRWALRAAIRRAEKTLAFAESLDADFDSRFRSH